MFNIFYERTSIIADYIPRSDTEFQAWVENFVTYANTHLADLGITPGDMIPISTDKTDFGTKISANVTAQQAAQSARQVKDDSRDSLESAVRALVKQLQASSDVDDTEQSGRVDFCNA